MMMTDKVEALGLYHLLKSRLAKTIGDMGPPAEMREIRSRILELEPEGFTEYAMKSRTVKTLLVARSLATQIIEIVEDIRLPDYQKSYILDVILGRLLRISVELDNNRLSNLYEVMAETL